MAEFQASQLSDVDTAAMGLAVRNDLQRRVREATVSKGGDPDAVDQQLATLQQALVGVNFTDLALHTLDENLFEQTLRAIDTQFTEQPLLQAELLQTLAGTMTTLGLRDQAQQPQTRALEIRAASMATTTRPPWRRSTKWANYFDYEDSWSKLDRFLKKRSQVVVA